MGLFKFLVRPSQVAIFVYDGQIADVFSPGKYELYSDSMPIFTSLSNWKYRFENHFKTDVYFINTKQFTNQKWGTTNPIRSDSSDTQTAAALLMQLWGKL
jgi:membrane protease subunit (stomatin/prohibitin family)